MVNSVKVGDIILITYLKDEELHMPQVGEVTHIDDLGQLHGTWGGLAVIPEVDEFEVLPF